MKNIISRIQKNRIFKFISSVKMAVILILVLAVVIGTGTIYESNYNAQVAGLIVYHTYWFLGLLGLLWLNIFSAAVSRVPFRKHHTGFVITHIGLLTLLIGSAITFLYGIDGLLSVQEGSHSRTAEVSDFVIKVVREGSSEVHVFPFTRSLNKKTVKIDDFSAFTGLTIQEYLPAVMRKGGGQPASGPGFSLGFGLQSQFFNVSETLHSASNAEMQMGPARIRLVEDREKASAVPIKKTKESKTKQKDSSGKHFLTVLDAQSGKQIAELRVAELISGGKIIQGVKVEVVKEYKGATVSSNHLVEGSAYNPAVELRLTKGKDSVREVSYQKFPTFSLSPNGFFGLKFKFSGFGEGEHGVPDVTSDTTEKTEAVARENPDRTGNVIEFHVNRSNLNSAMVKLFKNNERVFEKTLKPGETAETPWMGMKITFADLKWSAGGEQEAPDEVIPIEIPKRRALPPSAVRIGGHWLLEGEAKKIANGNERFEVYYGQNTVDLPFDVNLVKFEKVDYPGTEMAMSFQSLVSVNSDPAQTLIRMNEPLEHDGFVVYQSSYQLEPGQKPVSVFSVNKDPGRWLKYLGAVILVFGILTFIVMRSKWYLRKVAS